MKRKPRPDGSFEGDADRMRWRCCSCHSFGHSSTADTAPPVHEAGGRRRHAAHRYTALPIGRTDMAKMTMVEDDDEWAQDPDRDAARRAHGRRDRQRPVTHLAHSRESLDRFDMASARSTSA